MDFVDFMEQNKLRVYTLSGYPEEIIAVAFAKTSRSPKPFDEIVKELTEEKSSEFHEKWVVGYGHSSVAEHAVLHIAVENASRLAVEEIESTRLASFTEKSTRYQVIDKDNVFVPELDEELKKEYLETVEFLFNTYNNSIEKLTDYFEGVIPEEENEKRRKMKVRLGAIDCSRFLLPNATHANLGITINARALERMLVKMFSHPLKEVNEIASKIKEEGQKETPTLLKYTDRNNYIVGTREDLENEFLKEKNGMDYSTRLVYSTPNAQEKFLASVVYRFGGMNYDDAVKKVDSMSPMEKGQLIDTALSRLGDFDIPLREMEHIYFTFDLIMDQGAYYEFKRHRMCTTSPQILNANLGYVMPEEFEKAGIAEDFRSAMEKSKEMYNKIAENDYYKAQYITTNATKRRVLATMNLREVYHFIKLRGSPNAHFTIQMVAREMLEEIKKRDPLLVKYLKIRSF
ncbi:FAD-dependent thymidylate synthase [Candidatus Micrarchaeota archaeon]|nr:FAD-dependent thymidylate synthase [Candidatus Micrarchaeota archaeon]